MTPHAVLQAFLDEIGEAVLADDWTGYLAGVQLPLTLRTTTETMVIETEDALRRGYDQYRAMLVGLRVTAYIRLVEWAELDGPDVILGGYVTNLVSQGGQRLVPPFKTTVTLRRQGGRWRADRFDTDLLNARWPIGIPTPPPFFGSEP